ncbi:MAG: 3-deoxy-D-manno-octulosonic acid transferase [Alphaproteobacteria bacterium]|nr:3-deoxy-D-manno-octulosonic acid transferase [Alphaproteobacteria bacterium]
MSVVLYRNLSTLAEPLIALYLRRRLRAGKEDPMRFAERLGRPSQPRPEGALVWCHAASVGEALSALPLIEWLRTTHPALPVLFTTGTVTSATLLGQRAPAGVVHQFVPADRPAGVRRFLGHWRPALALWVESELWPNLISDTAARGVPMVLVNARMSERSFARWQRAPSLARTVLGCFRLCLAQSEADAARFAHLGAASVLCLGNLKHAAPPLVADPLALATLITAIAGRPVWLAASTHPGEEAMVGAVHAALAPVFPGLLTVIVPRHPERGPAVAAQLEATGMAVARRAVGQLPAAATAIYLADTMGELGLFYRLARAVFLGGSLVPHGGHNPLEPARLGAAPVYGPHMTNFAPLAAEFEAAGAAERVADGPGLTQAIRALLADPPRAARRGALAAQVAAQRHEVLAAITGALRPYLPDAEADAPCARA